MLNSTSIPRFLSVTFTPPSAGESLRPPSAPRVTFLRDGVVWGLIKIPIKILPFTPLAPFSSKQHRRSSNATQQSFLGYLPWRSSLRFSSFFPSHAFIPFKFPPFFQNRNIKIKMFQLILSFWERIELSSCPCHLLLLLLLLLHFTPNRTEDPSCRSPAAVISFNYVLH